MIYKSIPPRQGGAGGAGTKGEKGDPGEPGVTTVVTQVQIDETQTARIDALAAGSDDTRALVASVATSLLNEGFELQDDVLELFEEHSDGVN